MKTYKIKTGYWVSVYKEVDFTVKSDKKPNPIDEHDLLNLWENREDVLRIETDETTEEFEWADVEKLEIEEIQND